MALLAEGERRDPFRTPEVVWGTAGIALALLLGALAVWVMERWRKRAAGRTEAARELTDYRGMFERGEITEDEYARLRNRVAERVKPQSNPGPTATTADGHGLPPQLTDLRDEDDEPEPPNGAGNRPYKPPGPDTPTPPPGPGYPANPPPPV